jgi:hypothetical protein
MPETTPWWLLAISIISTAVVSIVGVVVPFWLEKARADREEARQQAQLRRNELAEIDRAAQDLLSMLATFKGPTLKDVEVTLTKSGVAVNAAQAGTILQSKFYAWESEVWKELSASARSEVKTLRATIERTIMPSEYHPETANPLAESMPEIADQVLTLTWSATGRE